MREQRIAQGRTQAECAQSVGMKLQYWNRLEKHVDQPEKETVRLIATALKVSEAEALETAGYSSAEQPPDLRLARKLDNILQKVSRQQRAKIEDMLEKDAVQYVSLLSV